MVGHQQAPNEGSPQYTQLVSYDKNCARDYCAASFPVLVVKSVVLSTTRDFVTVVQRPVNKRSTHNSIFVPRTFIFSNKVLISSWGFASGWNTKPSLKKIMSQGANDAFSTKGKKCCVFPFLPYTERDEKRSFLPAGGKSIFWPPIFRKFGNPAVWHLPNIFFQPEQDVNFLQNIWSWD